MPRTSYEILVILSDMSICSLVTQSVLCLFDGCWLGTRAESRCAVSGTAASFVECVVFECRRETMLVNESHVITCAEYIASRT